MKVLALFKVGDIAMQVREQEKGFLLEHFVGDDLHYSKTYKKKDAAMRDFEFLKRETVSGDKEPRFHLLRGHH